MSKITKARLRDIRALTETMLSSPYCSVPAIFFVSLSEAFRTMI